MTRTPRRRRGRGRTADRRTRLTLAVTGLIAGGFRALIDWLRELLTAGS